MHTPQISIPSCLSVVNLEVVCTWVLRDLINLLSRKETFKKWPLSTNEMLVSRRIPGNFQQRMFQNRNQPVFQTYYFSILRGRHFNTTIHCQQRKFACDARCPFRAFWAISWVALSRNPFAVKKLFENHSVDKVKEFWCYRRLIMKTPF